MGDRSLGEGEPNREFVFLFLMNESLTKREIIRDHALLERLVRKAPGVREGYLGVRFLPNSQSFYRIVVFVRRKTKSVMRNRLRRIGREMFRQSKNYLPFPCGDIALWLDSSATRVPHAERRKRFVDIVCGLADRGSGNG